jgi:hypothetical protein
MKVVIDSYALLGAIGGHPNAFAGIDEHVRKQASALLTAQLKHKSLDLPMYRSIVSAVTQEAFELFLDTADDKLLKALAKKLDPDGPLAKSSDADALTAHLTDLGSGRIDPVPKAPKTGGRGRGRRRFPSRLGRLLRMYRTQLQPNHQVDVSCYRFFRLACRNHRDNTSSCSRSPALGPRRGS